MKSWMQKRVMGWSDKIRIRKTMTKWNTCIVWVDFRGISPAEDTSLARGIDGSRVDPLDKVVVDVVDIHDGCLAGCELGRQSVRNAIVL